MVWMVSTVASRPKEAASVAARTKLGGQPRRWPPAPAHRNSQGLPESYTPFPTTMLESGDSRGVHCANDGLCEPDGRFVRKWL